MSDQNAADIAELRQRVSLLEEDAKGEKTVSRHILRKVSDNERAVLDVRGDLSDLRQDVHELRKEVGDIRDELTLLRADLPGIIAASIAPFFKK